ncbi:MAG: alpha-glucosidase [Candidatus Baldrarchaeia archaeon]
MNRLYKFSTGLFVFIIGLGALFLYYYDPWTVYDVFLGYGEILFILSVLTITGCLVFPLLKIMSRILRRFVSLEEKLEPLRSIKRRVVESRIFAPFNILLYLGIAFIFLYQATGWISLVVFLYIGIFLITVFLLRLLWVIRAWELDKVSLRRIKLDKRYITALVLIILIYFSVVVSINLIPVSKGKAYLKSTFSYDDYEIVITEETLVLKDSSRNKTLLAFNLNDFLEAEIAQKRVIMNKGSFLITKSEVFKYDIVMVENASLSGNEFKLSGTLLGSRPSLIFPFKDIRSVKFDFKLIFEEKGRVSIIINVSPSNLIDILRFKIKSNASEKIFGLGVQYSKINMKGSRVPIWVQEQGIGRGKLPDTVLLNAISFLSGGSWWTTYTPLPFFFTNYYRALLVENPEYSVFDFTKKDSIQVEVWSNCISAVLFFGENYTDLISLYTDYMGRMRKLPSWVNNGAIVRVGGGSDKVRAVVRKLLEEGVPLAGVWIEDWGGRCVLEISGAKWWTVRWNWVPDRTLYPDWEDLIRELNNLGVRVIIYFNPYLAKPHPNENLSRNLFEEALTRGYFVKKANGEPYILDLGLYQGGIIDLTNPEARKWYKELIKKQIEIGASGWMADFGEYLPVDSLLYNGSTGWEFHNLYPVEWAKLNMEAIREANAEGNVIFFVRAGFIGITRFAPLTWLGDQSVTWDEYDGLKSAVIGLITSGLSGIQITHLDIGGYFSVKTPILSYLRTKELFIRWMELATFTSFYRTHSTNLPEDNIQVWSDNETIAYFKNMTLLYIALTPIREDLQEEAEATGLPVIRPLFIHYPHDPATYELKYEFMYGPDIIVRPVLDKGVNEVEVYLPEGKWIHLWTNTTYTVGVNGKWVRVPAPLGKPPIFIKADSEYLPVLLSRLSQMGLV